MTKNESEYIIILNTCPGSITAKQIAQDLVINNLAACVNVVPAIQSYFKWGNQIKNETEYLLVIKTTRSQYPAIEKKINALHPYELPEVIVVPITDGSKAYLDWVSQNSK